MKTVSTFTFTRHVAEISVKLVCLGSFSRFGDLWELTDKSIEGVTVAMPVEGCGSNKFAIPLQMSLADHVQDHINNGVSAQLAGEVAYRSVTEMLRRDLEASDYGFIVDARIGHAIILSNYSAGFNFDYSPLDVESLDNIANDELGKCKAEILDEIYKSAELVASEISKINSFIYESK